ncbi:MAG: hypothetical protein WBA37_11710 [Xanthobacteraceae bacterium]
MRCIPGDPKVAFGDLGLEAGLSVALGLMVHRGEGLVHPLLHRELEFAPGVVELARLAQHRGLGLLRFRQLGGVGVDMLLQLSELTVALVKIIGQRPGGSLRLSLGNRRACACKLFGGRVVDRLARLRQRLIVASCRTFAQLRV